MDERSISLSRKLAEEIRDRRVVGEGGYQTLITELQGRLEGTTLRIDDDLTRKVGHYAFAYGTGGWQDLLRRVLQEIEEGAARK